MVQDFKDCKASLSRATLLPHPDPSAMLALFTDASDIALGAALQQRVCDACQPLAFYSHKLTPAQQSTVRMTASSWQCMRPSCTSDIWSKTVTLSFLRITSLSLMLSSNGEINAHYTNSITCSLLDSSLLTSGMSQGKTVLWQAPHRERTPSWHLLITMLLQVPRMRMWSCKTSWNMVRHFDWNECIFPGWTSISTATRPLHNHGHL